jgi:hypothetical protein
MIRKLGEQSRLGGFGQEINSFSIIIFGTSSTYSSFHAAYDSQLLEVDWAWWRGTISLLTAGDQTAHFVVLQLNHFSLRH